jgi:molecular chaperone GrpE
VTHTPDPQGTGAGGADEAAEAQSPAFTFHDRRRLDPDSGEARPAEAAPSAEAAGPAAASAAETTAEDPLDAEAAALVAEDRDALAARITELEEQVKRDQAEYVNSRRRIENSADQRVRAAKASVLASLISVLDDVDLARQHGELEEGTPFHSIAGKLEDTVRKQGMSRFGEAGEVFDPSEHEALFHEESDDVEATVIKTVLQPGYRTEDQILRPARVQTQGPA